MREFNFRLLESMGLTAGRISRAYGAYICETDEGTVLVRELQHSPEELLFAHKVKEYLFQNGFEQTDRFFVTADGLPYLEDGPFKFTVRRWLRGDEADFQNPRDAPMILEHLAHFHRLGAGMEEGEEAASRVRWYGMHERLGKQNRLIRGYYKNLRRQGRYTDFDLLFLKDFSYYEEQAAQAGQIMNDAVCAQEAERSRLLRHLIHGDFTDHAVVTDHRRMLITGFEKSRFAMPVEDLVTLFEKMLRKWNWDFERFLRMMEVYQRIRPMSGGEYRVLYAGLLFPERFVHMAQDAYGTKRRWISQSNWNKFLEIREMREKRENFLLRFRRYYQI